MRPVPIPTDQDTREVLTREKANGQVVLVLRNSKGEEEEYPQSHLRRTGEHEAAA